MTSKAYGALFLSPPILEEQKKGDRYLHTMVTDGSSRLRPGMELVLTRWIALSGTAKLAVEKEEELLKRFPETLVREAQHFFGSGRDQRNTGDCRACRDRFRNR